MTHLCLIRHGQTDWNLEGRYQGQWEGVLVADIRARYELLWAQRTVDPANVRPPGGETVGEVAARVYAALDDISRFFPAENVLVVSHGLSIATAICRAQNIPVGQAYSVIPENVQPVWMEWNADRPDSN